MASRAFLALTIVLALGGCTVTPPAAAPTTSPSPPTASPTVAHKFVPVYQVGGALLSGTTSALIVVDGDRGYVALDTTITAVDTTSGQQVWQEASPGPLDQLIPVGDVLVLVPAGANTVNALDAATGRPLWTEHESAALVFGGAVVLSRPDTGAQRAIEPRSGRQLWAVPGEGPTQTLAMQGTEDLVNLVAGKASIVNARTGAVTSMSAPGERLVAAFNGNVFTTRGATLIATRAGQASREIYTGTGELYGQPVQCQRTLICFVERRTTGQVVAVDPATAREVWRLDAGAPNATLTSDGTHAVVADRTGSRFVLENPKISFDPAIIRFAWAGHAIALGQARGSAFYNPEIPMKVSGLDLGAMTAVDLGELPAGTCGVGATVLVCLGDETITTWRFAV